MAVTSASQDSPRVLNMAVCWSDVESNYCLDKGPDDTNTKKKDPPAFAIDESINNKFELLEGKPQLYVNLPVGAIVNRTNERLGDWTGLSNEILKYAGAGLREECSFVPTKCQTGESKITRAYQLNCQFVIHTVGPKYTEQYKIAARTALHYCYRSCISLAKEQELRSIAFPCIFTKRKEYPRQEGAEVAVRTIRRFLEHFPDDFDKVVLYFEDHQDLELHKRALTLFCPRNEAELRWARANLASDVGDEWGDIVQQDRKIRISSSFDSLHPAASPPPVPVEKDQAQSVTQQYEDVIYGTDTFLDNANYKRHLLMAEEAELKDVLALNIVYECGKDQLGRNIVVIVVENMDVPDFDVERLFLYFVKFCDKLVQQDYVVVLVDADISMGTFPSLGWLQSVYADVIGRKYKKNLKAMYVVHPTWQLKGLFWAAMPFVSSKFWDKHHYCETLDDLYKFISPDYLLLPKTVYRADSKIVAALNSSWF